MLPFVEFQSFAKQLAYNVQIVGMDFPATFLAVVVLI